MNKQRRNPKSGPAKPRRAAGMRRSAGATAADAAAASDQAFSRQLAEDPRHAYRLLNPGVIREANCVVIPGSVLAAAEAPFFRPTTPDGTPIPAAHGMAQMADLLERMRPRDPLEEMLLQQMAWAHARVAHLTSMASIQQGLEQIRVIGEAVERAHNTYRRLMLAFSEYRNPRPVKSFTAFKQVNMAEQQVIQNNADPVPAQPQAGKTPDEKPRNEKGCESARPALPPVTEGIDLAAEVVQAREAVAADARAGHGGG